MQIKKGHMFQVSESGDQRKDVSSYMQATLEDGRD